MIENYIQSVPIGRRSTTRETHAGGTDIDFGGFPYPTTLLANFIRNHFPSLNRRFFSPELQRTDTRATFETTRTDYLSFDALVGRNSDFRVFTQEQLEELGGVEYRALTALSWIVAGVSVHLLFAFHIKEFTARISTSS